MQLILSDFISIFAGMLYTERLRIRATPLDAMTRSERRKPSRAHFKWRPVVKNVGALLLFRFGNRSIQKVSQNALMLSYPLCRAYVAFLGFLA